MADNINTPSTEPRQTVHSAIARNVVPSVTTGYVPGSREKIVVPIPIQGEETGGRIYRADFGGTDDPENKSIVLHPNSAFIKIRATLTDSAGDPITVLSGISLAEGMDSAFFESLELRIDGVLIDTHADWPILMHIMDRYFTAHNQIVDNADADGQEAYRRINQDSALFGFGRSISPQLGQGEFMTTDIYDEKEFYIYIPLTALTGFSDRRGRSVMSLANTVSVIARTNTKRSRWYYANSPIIALPKLNVVEASLVIDVEKLNAQTTELIAGIQATETGQHIPVDVFRINKILPFIPIGNSSFKQTSVLTLPSVPDMVFLIPFKTVQLNEDSMTVPYVYQHSPLFIKSLSASDMKSNQFFKIDGMTNRNGRSQVLRDMVKYFTNKDGSSAQTFMSSVFMEWLFAVPITLKPIDDSSISRTRPWSIRIQVEYYQTLNEAISWYAFSRSGRFMQLSVFPGKSGVFV